MNLIAEAQTRWLSATEVRDILLNFITFGLQVSSHVAHQPPSGSLILYDKRIVRFFRKDGHEWRKKAGGKGVREDHEVLKISGVETITVCYAHGEVNTSFHRRSYWLVSNPDLVLVHYLDDRAAQLQLSQLQQQRQQIAHQQQQLFEFQPHSAFSTSHDTFNHALQSFRDVTLFQQLQATEDTMSVTSYDASSQFPRTDADFVSCTIRDVAPGSDVPQGGAKILITGTGWTTTDQIFALFDRTEVATEHVVPGVVRCRAPPHHPGSVTLSLTRGNGTSVSNVVYFEYCHAQPVNMDWTAFGDRELIVRFIENLDSLGGTLCGAAGSTNGVSPQCGQGQSGGDMQQLMQRLQSSMTLVVRASAALRWPGLDRPDRHGACLLHYAAALGFVDVMQALIDSFVTVDCAMCGSTPLHAAIMRAHAPAVGMLLQAGANPYACDRMGKTPLDWARGPRSHTVASRVLRQFVERTGISTVLGSLSLGRRGASNEQELSRAAIRIQMAFRQHRQRHMAASGARSQGVSAHAAAATIQKWFRFTRRSKSRRYDEQYLRDQAAARKIQRAFRGHRAHLRYMLRNDSTDP